MEPQAPIRTPDLARASVAAIRAKFDASKAAGDFVGMDRARKFLQMGFTRSRRYANRASGRKYDKAGGLLPYAPDPAKAESASVFRAAWEAVEADPEYASLKKEHKERYG